MEKFVMAGSVPVRYSDFGKGERVICLLHGYLESIEIWDSFGGMLGKHFRVIAIDLPGHGISDWGSRESLTMEFMADVINSVLEKASIAKCCMVGHSMGGYVTAAMAELHPEKLNSIVFFHSTPNGDSPEKIELRKREIEAVEAGKKELLAKVNPGKGFASHNLRKFEEAIDEQAEQIMMTEDEAIVATIKGLMQRKDRNDIISAFEKPVLFIFGKHDNYISLEAAENVISKHPKAEIAWLENSGHTGFIEEPEKSYEILSEFVQRNA